MDYFPGESGFTHSEQTLGDTKFVWANAPGAARVQIYEAGVKVKDYYTLDPALRIGAPNPTPHDPIARALLILPSHFLRAITWKFTKHEPITSVSELAPWRGQLTIDGRKYDDLPGVAHESGVILRADHKELAEYIVVHEAVHAYLYTKGSPTMVSEPGAWARPYERMYPAEHTAEAITRVLAGLYVTPEELQEALWLMK